MTARWDFFWTTFRSRAALKGQTREDYWNNRPAHAASLDLPADFPLAEAIEAARRARFFGVGTSTIGVFEVQTPRGIYMHAKGYRNLAHARPASILFRSWDEIEESEEVR